MIPEETKKNIAAISDLLMRSAKFLPDSSPVKIWLTWLIENKDNLDEACKKLGVTMPDNGPNYFERLRKQVMPWLLASRGDFGFTEEP